MFAVEFGAGPFSPPGWPAIPTPEFWLLGGDGVWAKAGNATMARMAMAPVRRKVIWNSGWVITREELRNQRPVPGIGSPPPTLSPLQDNAAEAPKKGEEEGCEDKGGDDHPILWIIAALRSADRGVGVNSVIVAAVCERVLHNRERIAPLRH